MSIAHVIAPYILQKVFISLMNFKLSKLQVLTKTLEKQKRG